MALRCGKDTLVGRTLTAATFLGPNTNDALAGVADHLGGDLGLDVEIRSAPGGAWTSDDAEGGAAQVDLLWMCGRLLADLQRQRQLGHTTVAAPIFTGEQSAVYRSVIVARADGPSTMAEALSGAVAVNEPQSWSGHHALRRHVGAWAAREGLGSNAHWFAAEVLTGSHVASVDAVLTGRADSAAIDHSVWRELEGRRPELSAALLIIDATQDWPAPPVALTPLLNHNEQAAITQSILGAADLPGVVAFVAAAESTYECMLD